MAEMKQFYAGMLGAMMLGTQQYNAPPPAQPQKALGYTITPGKSGFIIANRSDVVYYRGPGVRRPYYGADQVFTATEWDNHDGAGFRPMPFVVNTAAPFSGALASIHFDQPVSYGPFGRGVVHVAGTGVGFNTLIWSVSIVATNGETNLFGPTDTGFSLHFTASAQCLANVNAFYGTLPGDIEMPANNGTVLDYIAFAFYK